MELLELSFGMFVAILVLGGAPMGMRLVFMGMSAVFFWIGLHRDDPLGEFHNLIFTVAGATMHFMVGYLIGKMIEESKGELVTRLILAIMGEVLLWLWSQQFGTWVASAF